MQMGSAAALFLMALALTASPVASSPPAEQDSAARHRYGGQAYLYAGEGCRIEGVRYVDIPQARLVEGVHRLALRDPTGRYSASDVYFDETALPSESEQAVLLAEARTILSPLTYRVGGRIAAPAISSCLWTG